MKDTDHNSAAEQWDEQYISGRWEYLSSVEQVPRYAIIGAWVELLAPGGSILDVGCGEGILIEWLRSCSRYEGVDISQVAIARARSKCQLINPSC